MEVALFFALVAIAVLVFVLYTHSEQDYIEEDTQLSVLLSIRNTLKWLFGICLVFVLIVVGSILILLLRYNELFSAVDRLLTFLNELLSFLRSTGEL